MYDICEVVVTPSDDDWLAECYRRTGLACSGGGGNPSRRCRGPAECDAVGDTGEEYATELLGRLPEHQALLARLDHNDGTDVITLSGSGPQGPCVHWGVVVIDDRYYLDPVPHTTVGRP